MIIIGLLLTAGMFYVVYEHYATPFKNIKKYKQQKKKMNDKIEVLKEAFEDEALKEDLEEVKKAYDNNEISEEKYNEIVTTLILDKMNGIENKNTENESIKDNYESNKKKPNTILPTIVIIIATFFLGLIITYLAYMNR